MHVWQEERHGLGMPTRRVGQDPRQLPSTYHGHAEVGPALLERQALRLLLHVCPAQLHRVSSLHRRRKNREESQSSSYRAQPAGHGGGHQGTALRQQLPLPRAHAAHHADRGRAAVDEELQGEEGAGGGRQRELAGDAAAPAGSNAPDRQAGQATTGEVPGRGKAAVKGQPGVVVVVSLLRCGTGTGTFR